MNRPARPTAAGLTTRRYHYWTGRSGREYVHGVYAPGELPHFAASSVLMVAHAHGRRTVVDVAATETSPDLLFRSHRYARALGRGVNELHLHLAGSPGAARAAAHDLSVAAATPASRGAARDQMSASGTA